VRVLLAFALAWAAGHATAEDWRYELKRWNTARGTPEESTRSTVRLERLLDGAVRLLRVDVPFPDEKTDFGGNPFNPTLGDVKVRVGFRAVAGGAYTFPSFVELTLPTAATDEAGLGKYQLGAGLRLLTPLSPTFGAAHATRLELEVQQVNSIGGEAQRADINATKLELTAYDLWQGKYLFKAKLKPSFDHVKDGSAAVAEVEAGFLFGDGWRTWLMLGTRVRGPGGIYGTYQNRVELGLAHTF
jgi:hypothetical protein